MSLFNLWIANLVNKSNDEALLFVMFQNDEKHKAMLYSVLIQFPQELMAQYAAERKVRAYCQLIKHAYTQRKFDRVMQLTDDLTEFLGNYAKSLLIVAESLKKAKSKVVHN